MTQIYLIDKSTFQQYQDISVNIKLERLNAFIKKAQDLDLKPFLGRDLYNTLLKQFDETGAIKFDTPQRYKDLLTGTEYLDDKGNIVLYEGLIPALVYFTFARFIENDAVHYTPTGPVIKHQDMGQALATSEIMKLVQQQRSIANAYANDVERYLNDHQQDFPQWRLSNANRIARQPGPRIRAVDRNRYNYPLTASSTELSYPITEFLN
ncbi:hypothetical protein LT679_07165 [Mucilaginibacter roseus]|uniref:Uncharacterized protein n=1 Tax=Mucilaginibacter roseus TaxID=1528868 RepID=A0ABS8U139_9SPHI|nr:hypothetical protein [Mucilaginibacter roseus]MCD8740377.1 hypothetical protein [Mucilaginibacter roseus]